MTLQPYYSDDSCVIYHGDCRDVLPELDADLVLTDPPYGIGVKTDWTTRRPSAWAQGERPVHGDDEPFDPTPLLRFRRLVLFGANHSGDAGSRSA